MKASACHHCAPPEKPSYFGSRFLGALICALPVWWLSMNHSTQSGWIQALFSSVSLFFVGWPLLERAWLSFKFGSWNMFSLIGVGLLSSWSLSVWQLFQPPGDSLSGFYFEGAATLVCFVLLGQFLEEKASKQTASAVEALVSLVPKTVKRVSPQGKEEMIPLERVQKSDFLRVLPGQQVPLDGVVTEGESVVDESLMTGEAVPVEKKRGDKVLAGTLNGTGSFVFQVTHLEKETELFKIAELVSKVQSQKIPIQKLADKISSVFTKWVFGIALVTGIFWWILGPAPKEIFAILQAVSVLMIACPCALGLATPISIVVGMRLAAKEGVLFRELDAIQLLEKTDTVVFDKTGTLTEGRPKVVSFVNLSSDLNQERILLLAASLESLSEHPLANAVVEYASEKGIEHFLAVEKFQVLVSKGAQAKIESQEVRIGSEEEEEKGNPQIRALREDGQTVFVFSVNRKVVALFGIQDPIRKEAAKVISQLKKKQIKLVLASGDHPKNTEVIARKLGLENWAGGLSPSQKSDKVKKLQEVGHCVAFVGDGINDAPALTQADVGVAMERGTDIAKQSAPVTLLHGGLLGFERTLHLSQAMMKNIRQNLFWAFSYNVIGIPLAAGLFYPLWGIRLTPVFSSVAMTVSSLLLVGNSLRLLRLKFRNAK